MSFRFYQGQFKTILTAKDIKVTKEIQDSKGCSRLITYDVYHARTEDCAFCPLCSRCLSKSDTSRRYLSIQVDTGQPNLIDVMKAKIDGEQGKKIYARRLGTLAPHAVQV